MSLGMTSFGRAEAIYKQKFKLGRSLRRARPTVISSDVRNVVVFLKLRPRRSRQRKCLLTHT